METLNQRNLREQKFALLSMQQRRQNSLRRNELISGEDTFVEFEKASKNFNLDCKDNRKVLNIEDKHNERKTKLSLYNRRLGGLR